MRRNHRTSMAAFAMACIVAGPASAHISYTNRNFGTFTSNNDGPVTISNVIVGGASGWADGTDDDWGSSEIMRPYRFTLTYDATVTIDAVATTNDGALLGDLLPGFSIYSGFGHLPPLPLDHDEAPISQQWLAAQPGTHEGNFRALGDWRCGNDAGLAFSDLTTFVFKAYAVDGTAANFGPAPGIVGDGLADGRVTATFNLTAGDYSIFLAGANYAAQDGSSPGNRGVNVRLAVPEPAAACLALPVLAIVFRRRRALA